MNSNYGASLLKHFFSSKNIRRTEHGMTTRKPKPPRAIKCLNCFSPDVSLSNGGIFEQKRRTRLSFFLEEIETKNFWETEQYYYSRFFILTFHNFGVCVQWKKEILEKVYNFYITSLLTNGETILIRKRTGEDATVVEISSKIKTKAWHISR